MRRSAFLAGAAVGVIWLIWVADTLFALRLYRFGVLPREIGGLQGILLAPLVHGSWAHLLANTMPLFVLSTALLYAYARSAPWVLGGLYVGSGLGVWIFGRTSYHVGVSGVTHGLMVFLFVIGLLRRDRQAVALALAVFFLYGGMIWGILPSQQGVSFESHFFGALSGLLLAFAFRHRDPKKAPKRYDWEDESGDGGEVIRPKSAEPGSEAVSPRPGREP